MLMCQSHPCSEVMSAIIMFCLPACSNWTDGCKQSWQRRLEHTIDKENCAHGKHEVFRLSVYLLPWGYFHLFTAVLLSTHGVLDQCACIVYTPCYISQLWYGCYIQVFTYVIMELANHPTTMQYWILYIVWPHKSAEQQRWAEYGNGVSEYRSYSLRQSKSLASYSKILKQLLVGSTCRDYHSQDQEVRHIQLSVLISCELLQSCLNDRPLIALLINQHFCFLVEILWFYF